MVYRSGKGSPHSGGTPVDVVPTTVGIPSTLTHYRGTTVKFNPIPAVIPQIPCHSLVGTKKQAITREAKEVLDGLCGRRFT